MQQMITEERRAGKHLAAICEKVKQDLDRSLSNCQDNTVARTIFEELTELSRNLKESHMRSHNRLFTVHSEISEFRESDLQFMVRPSNNREYTLMMSPTKKTVGVSRLFSIFGGYFIIFVLNITCARLFMKFFYFFSKNNVIKLKF